MIVSMHARESLSTVEMLLSMHAFTGSEGPAKPIAPVSGTQANLFGLPLLRVDRFRAAMTGGKTIKVVMLRYVEIQTIGERMR